MSASLVVTGYPRSGNIWLTRMLAQYLDVPAMGPPPFGKEALVAEGTKRKGAPVIQGHFVFQSQDAFLFRSGMDLTKRNGEKIILIHRDPRDVAVSVMHYWHYPTIDDAVTWMDYHFIPLDPSPICHRTFADFHNDWLIAPYNVRTSYEALRMDAVGELGRVLIALEIEPDPLRLQAVVALHEFAAKRQHLKEHGDDYYFGKEAQLEHMRNGTVGEWRGAFTATAAVKAYQLWGGLMIKLGYEKDGNWLTSFKAAA